MTFLKQKTQPGFILIEVMIALLLFGIMVQGGLGLYSELQRHKKQMETRQKQEKLLRALASYTLIHGRLPWAGETTHTEESYGKEHRGCIQGIIPFKTLGLSLTDVKDGFGHDFIYAMTTTRPTAFSLSPWEAYCRAYPLNPLVLEGYDFDDGKDFIILAILSTGGKKDLTLITPSAGDSIVLPSALPQGASMVWATRNMLISLYAHMSCAPFHQPLPDTRTGNTTTVRGYGR